ncbi:MAG: hypothetical protein FWD34_09520 [Oscillospiraceae bacterium]|nr:hypothetical protein [Oscillospiraceae bacterium]
MLLRDRIYIHRKRIFVSAIIISVVVASILFVYSKFFSTTVINNLNDYEKRMEERYVVSGMLPELDELPEYININYQYRRIEYFIFTSFTIRLVVTYDEETYIKEKAKLEKKDYLSHAVIHEYTIYDSDVLVQRPLIPEHEFSIKSFDFKVLDNDYYDVKYSYPKEIGFIATSDEKNSIAYLYFYDFDIDLISRSMEEFIVRNFKYDW